MNNSMGSHMEGHHHGFGYYAGIYLEVDEDKKLQSG